MNASEPMRAALAAAAMVRGATSPNPWVGAAIVRDGRIIATGATEPPPGRHAEAVALDAASGLGPRDSGLFVTLEPCAPFPGKRTVPCAERIIAAGIRRVVVALEDPDPRVRGKGIAMLRSAGIEVEVGDGAADAQAVLRPYLKHRSTGLPYVIAKFAASLDGRIATRTGDSKWITGELARDRGHQERALVDAVMAGSATVLADDPALTARPGGVAAARQPLRIVLDSRGRTPATARLFREPGPVLIATTQVASAAWRQAITAAGGQVVVCEPGEDGGVNLDQLLTALAERDILSVWAEGGGTVLGALFDGGHVDELFAFVAPVVIGGAGARPAVAGAGAHLVADAWRLRDPVVERLGGDILVRGYVGDWSP
jgi:diaminohydroxyphosphoribosylaminopyrimidine deaminase/5-amino-6-(5-phosphoribosylamino)uracil reductase